MKRGPAEQLVVVPLDGSRHDREAFSCGIPSLDRYLKQQATQDMRKRVAAVFVLTPDNRTVAGYFSLSQFSVPADHISAEDMHRLKLPKYPQIPATLLGRLAVDERFRGRGLGELLLFAAMERSLRLSTEIASAAVVVDAVDEQARKFYLRYGFIPVLGVANRLFLPMATIEAMLA